MTVQSYIFDFQRVPRFFQDWNNSFTVSEMQQTANNFQIVFCDIAPDNIIDCLNGSVLDTSRVNVVNAVDFSLKYDENDTISVRNDVTWNISNGNETIKAVFVRRKSNGYVMGYSIATTPIEVNNIVKIEKDTILWSIVNG